MNNEEKIKNFLRQNNGYITTAEFIFLGIGRYLIPNFIKEGLIRKVRYGLYIDNSLLEDPYYILQKRYPHAIFSYNTAFYILNLTNRTPHKIDISISRGSRVRGNYNIHYVSKKYYDIGIIEVLSPSGNKIKIYNAERCICDMYRNSDEFDLELQNRILDYYFNSKEKNIDRLLDYAKIFNIYEKINTIVGVMMKW